MRTILLTILIMAGTPALAEVKSASDGGFEVSRTVTIAAPADRVYGLLARPAEWWNSAHTYSGKAANLSLEAIAGGCFCEALPGGGSVQHARVVFAAPGKLLRLSGAFGPLQAEAVTGTLTFNLDPQTSGTVVTMNYVVGGYVRGGAAKLAAPVDVVMGDQIEGLKKAAEAAR